MKFRAFIIALTLVLIFFIPMAAIPPDTEDETPKSTENISEEKTEKTENAETKLPAEFFRIYDQTEKTVFEVPYEEYVIGAIASEMGAGFEKDALIAQGIAAFSCGLYQKEHHLEADYDFPADPQNKSGYITKEKIEEIYKDDFDEKWKILSEAAKTSLEYVITYDGAPAMTVYHAISAGMTESAKNVWGGEIPYLVPVESYGDRLSGNYETTVKWCKADVLDALNKCGAKLNGKYPEEWFDGAETTFSGYTKQIQIGAATFSGEKLRSLFGLRSTAFDVSFFDDTFIFTVRGYGHGVGMSQTGANAMAKDGADFKKILAHYYPGTKITERDNKI